MHDRKQDGGIEFLKSIFFSVNKQNIDLIKTFNKLSGSAVFMKRKT